MGNDEEAAQPMDIHPRRRSSSLAALMVPSNTPTAGDACGGSADEKEYAAQYTALSGADLGRMMEEAWRRMEMHMLVGEMSSMST